MEKFEFKTDLINVNWDSMKAELTADHFDNGRSPEQLQISFQNSAFSVIVLDTNRIIATARVLSDNICNAYLVDVWTNTDYRGKGIATHMISMLESKLIGQHIYLQTDDRVSFYHQLGYEEQPVGMSKIIGDWLQN